MSNPANSRLVGLIVGACGLALSGLAAEAAPVPSTAAAPAVEALAAPTVTSVQYRSYEPWRRYRWHRRNWRRPYHIDRRIYCRHFPARCR